MRLTVGSLVTLCLIVGCALTAPKPPQCHGQFRPVNALARQAEAKAMSHENSVALCMKGEGNAHQG